MPEITRAMIQERRQSLERQMADAKTRLLQMESATEKANNDVEAIFGAMQELDEWERRLFGPQQED